MSLAEDIKKFLKGETAEDDETLEAYSRDASLFKVRPKLVVYPKDSQDIQNLVKFAGEHKANDPTLSLTVRAAGSDMSGGPLNESIIVDVAKHMNRMGEIDGDHITVEPGTFYRDFERRTLAKGFILPCYPASKNLCAIGGMIANNAGGEKSLRYGKMDNFVLESKVIFADGREYLVRPLNKSELAQKINQRDFEGNLYKQISELVESNRDVIRAAKPPVAKNSAGYCLWNLWDSDIFDLNKLLVGSQGTLGVIAEAKLQLTPVRKHHDLVAVFFKSWSELPRVVNAILPQTPESLETFDDETLKLGLRFMPEIARIAKKGLFSFALKFLPEALIGIEMGGLPKLIILVEIAEDTEKAVKEKVERVVKAVKGMKVWHRVIERDSEEEKFWIMRRESFNLLRRHVAGKQSVPIVDDFCIPLDKVPEALPKIKEVLENYGIKANIAGHAGEGNFHIIPLMDLRSESERKKLLPVADAIYTLVAGYHGSITGEHNDGIVRTPYLYKMYSPAILALFKKTKEIFDPKNIFNPGKKVGGTTEYLESHIAIE